MKKLLLILVMFSFFACKKSDPQPQRFTILGTVTQMFSGLSIVSDVDEKVNFTDYLPNSAIMTGDRVYVLGELISQSGNVYEAKFLNIMKVEINSVYKAEEVDREDLGDEPIILENDNILFSGYFLNLFMNSTTYSHNLTLYIESEKEESNGTMSITAEICNNAVGAKSSPIVSFDLRDYKERKLSSLTIRYKNNNGQTEEKIIHLK
ncbi:MAG: NigD-like C-terminal domain-containing protein [Rikenellaceae bacterium]